MEFSFPIAEILAMWVVALKIAKINPDNTVFTTVIVVFSVVYQLLFIRFARGYPALMFFCPTWIVFSTFDYSMFLFALYLNRKWLRGVFNYGRLLGLLEQGKRLVRYCWRRDS